MGKITNDQELRLALDTLTTDQQRALGALFAQSVAALGNNPRLNKNLDMAMAADATEHDREDAYRTAKSIAVKTYTACGRDADWSAQAEHFVAAACAAALTPDALITEKQNLAWKAAIQARMAQNCMMIENSEGDVENEAVKQYEITEKYLSA
ncbi:MAG: hypothetical protein C0631_07165 [Sedimenticola sp.]|jgi:hypothetical protein|nr:MAG: hypothetical protein C0631_07165 [Sedimenticola sp.]